jgi:hypothetical protein
MTHSLDLHISRAKILSYSFDRIRSFTVNHNGEEYQVRLNAKGKPELFDLIPLCVDAEVDLKIHKQHLTMGNRSWIVFWLVDIERIY